MTAPPRELRDRPIRTRNRVFRPHSGGRSESPDRVMRKMAEAEARGRQWKRSYRTRVVVTDSVAVVAAVAVAQLGRFGLPPDGSQISHDWLYITAYSIGLAAIWIAALGLQASWDLSLAGIGSEEYRRVVTATAWVFGIIAVTDLLFQVGIVRGYLAIALPVGVAGLLAGRYLLRRNLARRRACGAFTNQIVVLGKPPSVVALCNTLNRCSSAGYRVVGACLSDFHGPVGSELETPTGSVPVLGDEHSVAEVVRLTNADALAVTSAEQLGQENMRTLTWQLDALGIDLIVVPGMVDIVGPRLKIRPIDNVPLFHVARPRHDGALRYHKRFFDMVFGTVALVMLSPVIVLAALAIKFHDGGPVFFRQERIGYKGIPFRIVKFRTMNCASETQLDAERAVSGQTDCIFYKSATDSRITPIGGWLRKTSIDEIPQLFNVIAGSMSIVGPRPLVPGEGSSVEYFIERRGLVKPGMTGLWQVSGRSDASAEERIRLDHFYVDNWSYVQDMVIILRTVRAVLEGHGAY
ncbi:sugar transferase [[Mycobacterium] appelbergii]|uniref:sugar transferase n=1 Tax=[Mycobacterium] appelbergii TaxID=2939269 RepID=UPI0029391674|nr:sugar transferase [Mycobacterium sp. 21AC1]